MDWITGNELFNNPVTHGLKNLVFSCIVFKLFLLELHADVWGSNIQQLDQIWTRSSPKLGKQSRRREKNVQLSFVDSQKQIRLPFWYRKAGDLDSKWKWVGANDEIDQNDLKAILEFDLGYGYLKPLPLQTGLLGIKDKIFVARPWHGESWSPYVNACYNVSQALRLPETLRWLEAWQVSSGIKTMIWPVQYLSNYPRSSLMSDEQGTWRSLCQQTTSLGNIYIRSISEKLEYLSADSKQSFFSWEGFVNEVRQVDWNMVNAYGPFSQREVWLGKQIYPIIPMLFVGNYFDILELKNMTDLQNYRFLLAQGHRLSQVMLSESSKRSLAHVPDMNIYRQSGVSDLLNLKKGRFSSSTGFAFDWVLESRQKKRYRSGEAFEVTESPLKPMFRFAKHPNFNPMTEVRLYKGSELMVSSKISDHILKGTIDLGLYYFKDHDSMSLEIEHKNGRISTMNPIYAGMERFFHSKVRDVPLRINNLLGEALQIRGLNSGMNRVIPLGQKSIELDLPWHETLRIESNGVQKELQVWRLWLNQAVRDLPENSSFQQQYQAFERSFPLMVTWPL